jgi:hypothetical protein
MRAAFSLVASSPLFFIIDKTGKVAYDLDTLREFGIRVFLPDLTCQVLSAHWYLKEQRYRLIHILKPVMSYPCTEVD